MTSVQIQPNIRPMTPAERAMYAAYALHPESTAYLLEVSLELIGGLDVERLGKAIGDLADHHDVLKSTYAFDGVGFTRTVREDLKTRLQAHTETSAKDSAGRSSSKPFDLAREVPMRAELFHNATHRHMLVLTFHHIACDAVSISLILTTLENLYNGAAVRADVEQPVVPSDTEHVSRREVHRCTTDDRVAGPTHRPSTTGRTVAAGQHGAIRDRPRHGGSPPAAGPTGTCNAVLTAALAITLARCSGQDAFLLGVPTDGRGSAAARRHVGCHANLVPIGVDCRDDPSARELLARIRSQTINVLRYTDLPLESITSALGARRGPHEAPLLPVTMQLLQPQSQMLYLDGLEPTPVPLHSWQAEADNATAKFELSFEVVAEPGAGDTRDGALECSADVFEEVTARRWVARLVTVVQQMVAAPDMPVSELVVLPDAERDLVVRQWNDTAVAFDDEATLWDLFVAQAPPSPDAPAVTAEWEGVRWTYAELARRAAVVAAGLSERGVGRGHRVGVCMARSADMVACLLGIASVGAAYVPLDPTHPSDRLQYMASNAEVSVVVVDDAGRGALADLGVGSVSVAELGVAGDGGGVGEGSAAEPSDRLHHLHLGFHRQTQGRQVEHRSIVTYLRGMQHHFPLTANASVLQATALAFDVSAYEIFWPLSAGAAVVVHPDHLRANMAAVAERFCATTSAPFTLCRPS